MSPGLRERKKRQTRETIVRAALALFEERGFDQVTVADIAAAADIAPRTFFAYFPTKEDVVFSSMPDDLGGLSEHLRGRPDGVSAVDALRDWIVDLLAEHDHRDPQEMCRRRIVKASPALEAHRAAKMTQFEALIREGVARDLGEQPDDLRPRLVAAAATATLVALDERVGDHAHAVPGHDGDPLELLDEALDFLRGGIAALRARQAPHPTQSVPTHP